MRSAGFSSIRTEDVPVSFAFRDLDEYERWVVEVTGPVGIVVSRLPENERAAVKAKLAEAFAPFVTDGGYELPGVALCAVAS